MVNNIKKRGFASMSKEKQLEIARSGGKMAHKLKRAHRFTSEEAKRAGRKGGATMSKKSRQKILELIRTNDGE